MKDRQGINDFRGLPVLCLLISSLWYRMVNYEWIPLRVNL